MVMGKFFIVEILKVPRNMLLLHPEHSSKQRINRDSLVSVQSNLQIQKLN